MKKPQQLKEQIKRMAQASHISAQLVLQNYMLERLLVRISQSKYRRNFILKGGYLIAAWVGSTSRTTMDMDATIIAYPVERESVWKMLQEIIALSLDDGISYTLRGIEEIREGDRYGGFRVSLTADKSPMRVPLKLDLTTGDRIVPHPCEYSLPSMFDDVGISVMAYNMESVLAEKLQTILARGDQNTRPRDFYDVYLLWTQCREQLDVSILREAFVQTSRHRGTASLNPNWKAILASIEDSPQMNKHWEKYSHAFHYAKSIAFAKPLRTVNDICSALH